MVAKSKAGQAGGGSESPDAMFEGVEGVANAVPVGSGGAGTVYRALQPRLRRTIAVKLMHDAVTDDGVRERFEAECQVSGQLSAHPSIVDVYGAGFTRSERPYILMEFVERGSFADRIERDGPLAWNEAVDAMIKVSGALETAHRGGILHRDIKPENLLWSDFDEPLLSDFGIAGLQEESSPAEQSWTIAHAAPELLTGGTPSAQSDLYALGSTLFALLCGQHAFLRDHDRTLEPVFQRIVHDPVPNLRGAGIPDALCTVMEQCMAKSPAHRFNSAEDFGHALQALQRSWNLPMASLTLRGQKNRAVPTVAQQPTAATPAPSAPSAPTASTAVPVAPGTASAEAAKRRQVVRGVLAGAVLGAILLAILLAVTGGGGEEQSLSAVVFVVPGVLAPPGGSTAPS